MSTTADTSPADIGIRPARVDDADRVFALLQELGKQYQPDRAAFDVSFAFLLADVDTSSVVILDRGGVAIGYALVTTTPLLHSNGRSAQLQELVVGEQFRGQGLGTKLIEAVEEFCRDHAVKQLTVPSRRSADFYERLGYTSTADFLKRTFD